MKMFKKEAEATLHCWSGILKGGANSKRWCKGALNSFETLQTAFHRRKRAEEIILSDRSARKGF